MAINTTEIGDKFETKSLGIIKKMIQSEQLTHLEQYLRIYQHKEYYSHLRKKNIVFDLTIEVWPPGADRYAFIYIIECKDYDTRIPVNKIEDFHSKIQQVTGVNVKGIFITNSPIQEAGFNIAESIGMMVIEGESEDNYKIVLYRTNRVKGSAKIPFLKETEAPALLDQGMVLMEQLIDKQILSALDEVRSETHVSYGIDKLNKNTIEQIVNRELNKINPDILSQAHIISPKTLTLFLKKEYDIDVVELDSENKLLGSCDMENKVIGISKAIKNTPREFFTLAHEFGHFILHQKLSIGQNTYDNFSDPEFNFRNAKHEILNAKNWIEWQANYFASTLVLPKVVFYYKLGIIQDQMNLTKGKMRLDDNQETRSAFYNIVNKLAYYFSVSKTTVIYKMNEMQLINDHSRIKTIGQLIAEYQEDLFT